MAIDDVFVLWNTEENYRNRFQVKFDELTPRSLILRVFKENLIRENVDEDANRRKNKQRRVNERQSNVKIRQTSRTNEKTSM